MQPLDPFPRVLLDRSSAARTDPEALAALWERPQAVRISMRDGAVAVPAGDRESLSITALSTVFRDSEPSRRALLGIDPDERPWWLVLSPEEASTTMSWVGLREIGPRATAVELEALMTAAALEAWHSRHAYCPACGTATDVVAAGWVRRCPNDGTEHYPRTDPAIIVLVLDDRDRALLGRQTRWPPRWRSTLAGFVEPGESAEAAVRREVAEEVGVALEGVGYVASQPWPFPGSLMIGFHARASGTDITVDGDEIAAAEWYSREELRAAAASGRIQLPPPISIARRLIEQWYGDELPNSWSRA